MKPTDSVQYGIERRRFLKYGVAGMAIASTSHVVLASDGIKVSSEPEEFARDRLL